jgi:hypothetical protein
MYALRFQQRVCVLPTTVFPAIVFPAIVFPAISVCVCVPGLALKLTLIGHLGLPLLIWWVDTLTYLSRE